MRRVLIAEDEIASLHALEAALSYAGYSVLTATRGNEVIPLVAREDPDILLLDIGLPEMDGIEVCQHLRAHGYELPVIMISDKWVEENHRIAGLHTGADDYLPKGFKTAELLALMEARLRRYRGAPKTLGYSFGDVVIDFATKTVRRSGELVKLTSKEYDLLDFLIRHRGEMILREKLLQGVWGYTQIATRTLDTHIFSLRQKLEPDPSNPRHILSGRGAGYGFD